MASNKRSCDNKGAQIKSGPGGGGTPLFQGLTANQKERLMLNFTRSSPGLGSRLSELDQWRGEDVHPFGGVA